MFVNMDKPNMMTGKKRQNNSAALTMDIHNNTHDTGVYEDNGFGVGSQDNLHEGGKMSSKLMFTSFNMNSLSSVDELPIIQSGNVNYNQDCVPTPRLKEVTKGIKKINMIQEVPSDQEKTSKESLHVSNPSKSKSSGTSLSAPNGKVLGTYQELREEQ